jgi:hypothetical protein
MPNGVDKNFVRLCIAIDGFRAKFGCWPTKALLADPILENLESLFQPATLRRLRKRISLELGDEFAVADEHGHVFRYGIDEAPDSDDQPSAMDWLGVQPDALGIEDEW